MKAIEAAEHSDVIWRTGDEAVIYYRSGYNWYYRGVIVDLEKMAKDDYVPLVTKKIYQVGDKVTFLEALNSGMCFKDHNTLVLRVTNDNNGSIQYWHDEFKDWRLCSMNGRSLFSLVTLCEDPSIPPKPTLESLPAWTRCKVVLGCAIFDVVKMPGTGGPLFYRDKYGILTNSADNRVKLLSVYNPKTEQWEDV